MNKINFQEISLEQGNELVENKKLKAKPIAKKIINWLGAQKGFLLKNDTTIVFWEGKVCKAAYEDISKFSREKESIFENPPTAEEFIQNVNNYLLSFYKYFGKEGWDFTVESLEKVDKLYPNLEEEIGEGELFLPLATYLGEVLKKETNGNWSIEQNKQNRFVVIIGENGKTYDPYFRVLKIITKNHRPFAFYSAVDSQLNPVKLKAANPKIVPYNPYENKN